MSHYSDLSPCRYYNENEKRLTAVGWLEEGFEYSKGIVSEEFLRKLVELLVGAPRMMSYFRLGSHACSICPDGVVSNGEVLGKKVRLGAYELFVPASERRVYVAPSTIAHYITEHGYSPPQEFQDAVLECPKIKSLKYYLQIWYRGVGVLI